MNEILSKKIINEIKEKITNCKIYSNYSNDFDEACFNIKTINCCLLRFFQNAFETQKNFRIEHFYLNEIKNILGNYTRTNCFIIAVKLGYFLDLTPKQTVDFLLYQDDKEEYSGLSLCPCFYGNLNVFYKLINLIKNKIVMEIE